MWTVYDNLSSQQVKDSRLEDCVPSREWPTSTCSFGFRLDKYLSQKNEFQSQAEVTSIWAEVAEVTII